MRAVVTADWHLRGERPVCRTDADWIATQRKAIRFVLRTARTMKLPLYIVGDIFHTPRVATEVTVMLLDELRQATDTWILAGNHDLPYHSYDNVAMSSFGILRHVLPEIGSEQGFDATPFGLDAPTGKEIAFTHQLVFPDEASKPSLSVGKTAADILEQFPDAKWVFCGDYHHAFHYEHDGRHVVNPGCILRQAADMMDYEPSVYLVDTTAGTVERIPVPDPGEVVTDAHLRKAEEREDRIGAFLEQLRMPGTVTLSFRDNLERKLESAAIGAEVRTELAELLSLQHGAN